MTHDATTEDAMAIADFDAATALSTTDAVDDDVMLWHGHMTADWSIGPVPNGGYTSSLLLRGLLGHTGCKTASSATTHYYRPTIGDAPCTVRTEIKRRGRSTTHADATLEQDGKVRARAIAVLGNYPVSKLVLPTQPRSITPAEDCQPRDPLNQGLNMTLLESLDVRLDPASETDFPIDGPGVRIDGWVRFRDDRPNDGLALSLFVDAFPPAVLMAISDTGWVPTIELTTHIRAEAAPGWIRGEVSTANVRGGTLVEDVRLWDSSNTLVAEARQLAWS